MRRLVYDVSEWQQRKATGTFLLLLSFYLIGLLLFDGHRLTEPTTYRMDTWIVSTSTLEAFTLTGKFEWQWQVLTFYLIHFALVHYGYSGFLMLFYMAGLEKGTSTRFALATFFVTAILSPIILSPLLFFVIKPVTDLLSFGILHQRFFLGSSVGIWGTIGMTISISRKRRFYWVPIFLLLFLEFFLKLAFIPKADITANIVHLIVFFSTYLFSRIFIDFRNNNLHVGEIRLNGRGSWIMFFLLTFHSLIMIIHFVDTLGLLEKNLLSYLF